MITEGLEFMVVGMAVVFSFLILLVVIMKIDAVIITRFFPEKQEPEHQPSGNGNNAPVAAAIAVAHSQRA